jgi:hypothetical protein
MASIKGASALPNSSVRSDEAKIDSDPARKPYALKNVIARRITPRNNTINAEVSLFSNLNT